MPKLKSKWIKGRNINGQYGYINIDTNEFRSTIPNSTEDKKQQQIKTNNAILKLYSERKNKFDKIDANRRNHSDEIIKKHIKIPKVSIDKEGNFYNYYVKQLAPGEESLSGTDPVGSFIVANAALNSIIKGINNVATYGLAKIGNNWARNKIINNQLNKHINNVNDKIISNTYPNYLNVINRTKPTKNNIKSLDLNNSYIINDGYNSHIVIPSIDYQKLRYNNGGLQKMKNINSIKTKLEDIKEYNNRYDVLTDDVKNAFAKAGPTADGKSWQQYINRNIIYNHRSGYETTPLNFYQLINKFLNNNNINTPQNQKSMYRYIDTLFGFGKKSKDARFNTQLNAFAVPDNNFIYIPKSGNSQLRQQMRSHEREHLMQDAQQVYKDYVNKYNTTDIGFDFYNQPKNVRDYFMYGDNPENIDFDFTELLARGSQIKNLYGMSDGNKKITEQMLKSISDNYYKIPGVIDNQMNNFFKGITDYKKAANFLSYANSLLPIGIVTTNTKKSK